MSDLLKILNNETANAHLRLEELPYFQRLRNGDLPRIAVVTFLRCLSIIHAVVERSLSEISAPEIVDVAGHPAKLPLLAADIEALGGAELPSVNPAVEVALDYAAEVLTIGDTAVKLIGILYVLEGSQIGALELKRAYARCLDIPEDRLASFGSYGRNGAAHWTALIGKLNNLFAHDAGLADAVNAANRCFARLEEMCRALYPYSAEDLRHHVAAINFEAGDHAMPQDPREIALALRAGRAAWDKYPYLCQRFGERGRRFTSSDSCWLLALTRLPIETTTKSLIWLRTVLASRGIPTVILEDHLRAIQVEMAVEFPAEQEMRMRFDPFLARLAVQRQVYGEERARLAAEFEPRFRACSGANVPSAAQLILSAWTDSHEGIPGAFNAMRSWLFDPKRFSEEWIATGEALVAAFEQDAKLC